MVLYGNYGVILLIVPACLHLKTSTLRPLIFLNNNLNHCTDSSKLQFSLISPPGSDSLRSGLKFCCGLFLFPPRVISELRGPIAANFCKVLLSMFDFIFPVRNYRAASPKNFRSQKRAKFGPILVEFKVRRRISLEGIKLFKIGELLLRQRFRPALGETSPVKFGPVTLEI